MIVRSILIYAIVLILFRIMGKRQLGQMQPYELVITLIIADLATIPMSDTALPLAHGIIPIITISLLHFVLAFINRKSLHLRRAINGNSIIIIDPMGINYNSLKELNMNFNDLMEALRTAGYFNLEEVLYAIVQTNGSLSVLPRAPYAPLTAHDINLPKERAALPIIVYADGRCVKENMNLAKIDEAFLSSCILQNGYKNLKDIALITLNSEGKLYCMPKSGQYFTVDSGYSGGEW